MRSPAPSSSRSSSASVAACGEASPRFPRVRSLGSRDRDRANERDDQRRDEEEEHDREERREIEDGRTGRLGEDALERPHERLGDTVEARDQRLLRVGARELEDEAVQQKDIVHGEKKW